MNSKVLKSVILCFTLLLVPQYSEAQIFNAIKKGVKEVKGLSVSKKYKQLKEKAEVAMQNNDIAYLMSEECMVDLKSFKSDLTGSDVQDYQELSSNIKDYFYALLHTSEDANFIENIDDVLLKAKSAPSDEVKALYVDAAIGIMNELIKSDYDIVANRGKLDAVREKIMAEYNTLQETYKSYKIPENTEKIDPAYRRDPRYLHNMKGGIPDVDKMISYREEQKKKAIAAAEAQKKYEAAEQENRKKMFKNNNNSVDLWIYYTNPGSANLERRTVARIESGSAPIHIYEGEKGYNTIGKFELRDDEYVVYANNSTIGYIDSDCIFYDSNHRKIGTLSSNGDAYNANGSKIGSVGTSVEFSSYRWRTNTSINNKIFTAALCIFYNSSFANIINVKSAM